MNRNEHPFLVLALRTEHGGKEVSASDAVRLIRDGEHLGDRRLRRHRLRRGSIAVALEDLFLATEGRASRPGNLTLVYAAGQGDGNHRGLNHFRPSCGSWSDA